MSYIVNKKNKIKIQKTTSPTAIYGISTSWQMIPNSVISYSCAENASSIAYSHVFQLAGPPDANSFAHIKIVSGPTSANDTTIGDFTDINIESKDYGFTHGGASAYRDTLVKSEFIIDSWSGEKKVGLAIGLWNMNNQVGVNGMAFFDDVRYWTSSTLLAGISNTIIYSIM